MPLLDELRKPFNLLSTAIAVVSLVASIYFYYATLQRREPVYLVQKSSQIVSGNVSSPHFRVVDNNGAPILGDIHLLELVFWNAGRLAIEPSDVRNPVQVVFPLEHKLLDAKIVRQTKPTVTDFAIAQLPSEPDQGPRLRLSWKHLDPGLGTRLQFIYVGKPNPPLLLEGDILDATIDSAEPAIRNKYGGLVPTITLVAAVIVSFVLLSRLIDARIYSNNGIAKLLLIVIKWTIAFGVAFAVNWSLFSIKIAPA